MHAHTPPFTIPEDAATRKSVPLASGLLNYFPDALVAVASLSFIANEQHNPGETLHWNRYKSTDHDDCLMRHFMARGTIDTDKVRHRTKVAWRALAALQEEIERDRAAPACTEYVPAESAYLASSSPNRPPIDAFIIGMDDPAHPLHHAALDERTPEDRL